jgi:hypothetical protein
MPLDIGEVPLGGRPDIRLNGQKASMYATMNAISSTKRGLQRISMRQSLHGAGAVLLAGALIMGSALALAQEAGSAKAAAEPGFFESIGSWFERQADNLSSSFKDAGKQVTNFGHEAGIAAKTTVEGAKEAAGAVARIPATRVVAGHAQCRTAPNGAPDCVAAATTICKAKGFDSGKSMDMTTAEVCPAQVYLAGRNSGPGCHTETFVSSALCQ